ncbi:hypothetical protein L2E82_24777 [Cichorium intybus]|uniref:Uncharacterized protein n=1 Tax=Cichorium intybus TaxID=13427 RepID=A0ACB9E229_CICIN|nr:hypothetical protein L2E82_24777 [Cichorium intybus]
MFIRAAKAIGEVTLLGAAKLLRAEKAAWSNKDTWIQRLTIILALLEKPMAANPTCSTREANSYGSADYFKNSRNRL